jgi:tetraacyldisaccharide 4'-kinase
MCLKTPFFWYQTKAKSAKLVSILLLPFSYLYLIGHLAHQNLSKKNKSELPVICIGNINAGGSGKTPSAIAVMALLKDSLYKSPVFLTKGYKGSLKGPLFINKGHDVHETGDEAPLLLKSAKTIISKNRAKGANFAKDNKADLIILDDGLQNPGFIKDINIIIIDGKNGFGNKYLLPAGPLREPLQNGLRKADAFILIGEDQNNLLSLLPKNKPIFKAFIKHDEAFPIEDISRVIGFAGIGHPEKFLNTLKDLNLEIIRWYPFPDHHFYSEEELNSLAKEAKKLGARLITTEKDYVRIAEEKRKETSLLFLPIKLEFEEPNKIKEFIVSALKEKNNE